MNATSGPYGRLSWYEGSARDRLESLVDSGSFMELLGPQQRETSPHLCVFGLPVQFDDGLVAGAARLEDRKILLAAQEGRFMGGAFGEVHAAKLVGLLRAARLLSRDVILLFDTGGVRLQEANAGEVGVAEIVRAVVEARVSGIQVVGLIGGRAGCFGGGSLIAAACSTLIVSEHARIGVTGPEVIETNRGVEEFDSTDRALVWRTTGGKHRYLTGGADEFVEDSAVAFRLATLSALDRESRLSLKELRREHRRLEDRLTRFGHETDARGIWRTLGIQDAAAVTELSTEEFQRLATHCRISADGAR